MPKEISTTFFVFFINTTSSFNEETITLIKEREPYDGHKSYEDAKEWIRIHGDGFRYYTILEIFK
jgi:hypothetical protein